MPTYQYVCSNADGKHEFEVVQSFSDDPLTSCPSCEAPVRKVYGSVGVVFKGSGFYRTDSRAAAKNGSGSSSSSSSPSSSSSSSSDSSSTSSSNSSSSTSSSSSGTSSGTTKAAAG